VLYSLAVLLPADMFSIILGFEQEHEAGRLVTFGYNVVDHK
jgi:hypothetical protein